MWKTLCVLSVVALGVIGFGVADEEDIAIDKLPKAVKESVQKRFPKAKLESAAKETEDGKTLFEVSLKDDGAAVDVMVTPEGVIELIERTIAADKLPEAVSKAVAADYPGAKFERVEELIEVKAGKETLASYEIILVNKDGKKLEVKLAQVWKVIEVEDAE